MVLVKKKWNDTYVMPLDPTKKCPYLIVFFVYLKTLSSVCCFNTQIASRDD